MSEKYYKRLDNGQVAGLRFDTEAALPELNAYYATQNKRLVPEVQNALRNANLKVTSTAATVGDSKNQVKKWINDIETNSRYGERTGKSPQGFRNIFQGVKQKVAALPSNNVLQANGATPDLHNAYDRILNKEYGERFFKGVEGGNYVAPMKMHPTWIKFLSRVLPIANIASIPQTADLYNNIKTQGPTQGYLKWLGINAQPRKWY